MKNVGFLLALTCMLSLTGCGMAASTEGTKTAADEISQSDVEANAVSVNFNDMATQSDHTEQYCDYLVQITESMFIDEEGIKSANARISYDDGTEQYSIELSLKTNGKANSEQIKDYKTYLSKTYADVTLIIDGKIM